MTKIKQILMGILKFFFITFLLGIITTLIVPFLSNSCKNNSSIKNFDVIIVLGSPATTDCNPSLIMKDRVAKGIELFKMGIGKKILSQVAL